MGMSNAEKSARYRAKDVDAYRAKKAALARTEKHRETRRLYMQQWREKNREKHNAYSRERHRRLKDSSEFKMANRSSALKQKYGITHVDYVQMLEKQNGRCLICGTDSPGQRSKHFHVDHCHETGAVRGLLCAYCNTGIGWYERNAEKAKAYLSTGINW